MGNLVSFFKQKSGKNISFLNKDRRKKLFAIVITMNAVLNDQ